MGMWNINKKYIFSFDNCFENYVYRWKRMKLCIILVNKKLFQNEFKSSMLELNLKFSKKTKGKCLDIDLTIFLKITLKEKATQDKGKLAKRFISAG